MEMSHESAPAVGAHTAHTSSRATSKRQRRRLSPLTVIGELLLVSGIAAFGYLLWQPWHTGVVVTAKQVELTTADSQSWNESAAEAEPWSGEMPVVQPVAAAEVFGVLHVPAFGESYANRIAETTDWWSVLNLDEKGIGHYEYTQMPGEPGNFVIAGHRSGPLINSFKEVMNLRVGDPLFVETPQGWYTYRFRSFEYVWPDEVNVTAPFPIMEGRPGTDQILTITTCHPKDSGSAERAIAYAVLESYQPLSEGPPAELLETNPALGSTAS